MSSCALRSGARLSRAARAKPVISTSITYYGCRHQQMLVYLYNPHRLYERSDVRDGRLGRRMFKRFKIDPTDELDVEVAVEMLEPFPSVVHV